MFMKTIYKNTKLKANAEGYKKQIKKTLEKFFFKFKIYGKMVKKKQKMKKLFFREKKRKKTLNEK